MTQNKFNTHLLVKAYWDWVNDAGPTLVGNFAEELGLDENFWTKILFRMVRDELLKEECSDWGYKITSTGVEFVEANLLGNNQRVQQLVTIRKLLLKKLVEIEETQGPSGELEFRDFFEELKIKFEDYFPQIDFLTMAGYATSPVNACLQITPLGIAAAKRMDNPTIGIVTALSQEYAAVRAMLDDIKEPKVTGDPNVYTLGSIPSLSGGHHVVVVTLLKQMGNNSAASAATNLLRTFSSIDDVLMVGIAGGIPQKGLRLGDVAVSNEKGVMQYDNIKVTDREVEIRDTSGKPSARLIGKVKSLEAKRIEGRRPWENHVVRAKHIENSDRPPSETDIFGEEIPERKFPKIFYGLIGSSNTLLKSADFRDSLAEKGVIAVEMEGSGIADGTWEFGKGYLLIRGISDYCDIVKNDIWQGYAAAAAAAYMRALIESIPVEAQL